MKTPTNTLFYTLLLSLLTALPLKAQTAFGNQQIIQETLTANATDVHAADLDNDGDMDMLSASQYDYKIVWYENDGNGNFETQQIITTDAITAYSV